MYFSVCDLSPPHTELFRTETFLWPTTVYMLSEQCPVSDYHLYVAPLPHGKWKGKDGSSVGFPLLGLQNHCGQWLQSWNQKMTASWQESYDKPRQCIEKQRHYSAGKGPYSQDYGLLSGHLQLWELDYKEGIASKNWCLQTVVLKKTPESPLDS